MARYKEPEPPKRFEKIIKSVTRTVLLAAIVAGLLGGYWLLTAPQRNLPNPTKQQGVGNHLADLRLLPLTGDSHPVSLQRSGRWINSNDALTGDSGPVSLQNLKNKVVLLNFWGTWCRPCRAELPHIADLQKHFAGRAAFRLAAISYPPGGEGAGISCL